MTQRNTINKANKARLAPSSGRHNHWVREFSDGLDNYPNDIPITQEPRRLANKPDPPRGSRHDDVTRLQRDGLREIADQLCDRKNHVLGVAVLHQLLPHPSLNAERLRMV